MPDNKDLVARLRAVDHMSIEDCFLQSPLFAQAADRIEALEARSVPGLETTAEEMVEHVRQVLRDYGIAEETIANDPELGDTTRAIFTAALAAKKEKREAAEALAERYKAALREIADHPVSVTSKQVQAIARAVLSNKTGTPAHED